jgi:hypothetical protein
MAAKSSKKKAVPESQADFAAAFNGLRAILVPYAAKKMRVVHDTSDYYCLETTFPVYRGKPMMFAAVRKGKAYVSYHLVPLYMIQALQAKVSAEMKRRKQGKGCLNFTRPDKKLFAEVASLTKLGLECFKKLAASEARPNTGGE